jgi:hypothetical protein
VSTGTKNPGEIEHPSHVKRREAAAELRWIVSLDGKISSEQSHPLISAAAASGRVINQHTKNAASEPQPDQATSKVWTARADRAVLGIEKDGAYDQREI